MILIYSVPPYKNEFKVNPQGTVKTRYFLLYLARMYVKRFLLLFAMCMCRKIALTVNMK